MLDRRAALKKIEADLQQVTASQPVCAPSTPELASLFSEYDFINVNQLLAECSIVDSDNPRMYVLPKRKVHALFAAPEKQQEMRDIEQKLSPVVSMAPIRHTAAATHSASAHNATPLLAGKPQKHLRGGTPHTAASTATAVTVAEDQQQQQQQPPSLDATLSREILRVTPSVMEFKDFKEDEVYSGEVKITNVDGTGHTIRTRGPPDASPFRLTSRQFPAHASHPQYLAPGLSATLTIKFRPRKTDRGASSGGVEYRSTLVVLTEGSAHAVELWAYVTAAVLAVPRAHDCGTCIAGTTSTSAIALRNTTSGAAKYIVLAGGSNKPDTTCVDFAQWDAMTQRTVEAGPFSIFPQAFLAAPSDAFELRVEFSPQEERAFTARVHLVRQGPCNSDTTTGSPGSLPCTWSCLSMSAGGFGAPGGVYTVELAGRGFAPRVDVARVNGAPVPSQAVVRGDGGCVHLYVAFDQQAEGSRRTKKLVISNCIPLEITYHWELSAVTTTAAAAAGDVVFDVSPAVGAIAGSGSTDFDVTFTPRGVGAYSCIATFITDNCRPPAAVASVQFKGTCVPLALRISPPLLYFAEPLVFGEAYRRRVTLFNDSEALVNFDWQADTVVSAAGCCVVEPSDGELSGHSSIEFAVTVTPCINAAAAAANADIAGNIVSLHAVAHEALIEQTLACRMSLPLLDGARVNSLHLSVSGKAAGPTFTVSPTVLSFPLMAVNEIAHLRLAVSNVSRSQALTSWRIVPGTAPEAPNESTFIEFAPAEGALAGGQRADVSVRLAPTRVLRAAFVFKLETEHCMSPGYVTVKVDVQQPKVVLEQSFFDLGKVYAGGSITFTPVLKNLTRLSIPYYWTDIVTDQYSLRFGRGARGVLPPCGQCVADATFSPPSVLPPDAPPVQAIVSCHVKGVARPPAFVVHTKNEGLTVGCSFAVTSRTMFDGEDSDVESQDLGVTSFVLPLHGREEESVAMSAEGSEEKAVEEPPRTPPELHFGRAVPIFTTTTTELTLSNLSTIPTRFRLSIAKYGLPAGQRLLLTGATPSAGPKTRLLGAVVERPFYCVRGQDYANQKQIGNKLAALKTEGGVSVLISPTEGPLAPHSSAAVQLTCCADMCGSYTDTLTIEIDGLQICKVPISIAVSGTPLSVVPNTFGLQLTTIPPSISWATLCPTNTGVKPDSALGMSAPSYFTHTRRTLKIANHGPFDIDLFWSQERVDGVDAPSPFTVAPARLVIKSHGVSDFTLRFASAEVGEFHWCLVGHGEIIPGGSSGTVGLPPFKVHLFAATEQPAVTTTPEKRLTFEFAYEDAERPQPSAQHFVRLANSRPFPLDITLAIDPPFVLSSVRACSGPVGALSSPDAKKGVCPKVALPESGEVEVGVRYVTPAEQLAAPEQCADCTVERPLTVLFANGRAQTLPIAVQLRFPQVTCEPERVDFAGVAVGDSRTLSFTVRNTSRVHTHWRIVHAPRAALDGQAADYPAAFTFTCTAEDGSALVGPCRCEDSSMVPAPAGAEVRVAVAFTPQHQCRYESIFGVVPLVGTPDAVTLRGVGIFNERFH
eukprot:TRINITY_DN40_c0_g1_i3.p1 TRINITY_DN40_c0_g1~~TRINITY_DN40_c0_g1_i3.p1  ORF type:complete len:1769 (+),score=402.46 TRINITY_DN40_c0_g1_i3:666-5309(+)